jgi:RNA polymerase sigma factor for flagellar operon FliA
MLDLAASAAEPVDEEASLWRALRDEGSAAARERLFTLYLPFARGMAGRQFRGRAGGDIEYEDLFQLACTGLLEAIDRFDPALGVPFRGFAVRRVKGSLIDGIARTSEIREQIRFRNRVQRERLRSLADPRGDDLSHDEAMEALVDMAVGLALGFMLEGTTLYHKDGEESAAPSAYDSLAWKEMVQRVTAELVRLPERDRRIIQLHYLEDVTFDRIAALLGLTKGRISQLHKAALLLLRKRISGVAGFRLER